MNITPLPHGVKYTLDGKDFTLKLIGQFNVSNALAAIAACSLLGIDKFDAAQALRGFLGTHRRLEVVGVRNNISVIDDFAHNPDKVKASVSALRDYPGRLIMMFQPHGFTPMRMMGRQIIDEFTAQMNNDDLLLLCRKYILPAVQSPATYPRRIWSIMPKGQTGFILCNQRRLRPIHYRQCPSARPHCYYGARDNTLPEFCKTILKEIK